MTSTCSAADGPHRRADRPRGSTASCGVILIWTDRGRTQSGR